MESELSSIIIPVTMLPSIDAVSALLVDEDAWLSEDSVSCTQSTPG